MMSKTCTTELPKYIIQEMKFIAIIVLLFGSFHLLNAQDIDPIGAGIISQQVSSTVAPENPNPGQDVTITLTAYGTNLNAATISWSINGSRIQGGTGMTQFVFNAGRLGETKRVVATISPTSGPIIIKSFTISPQEVSIIYESDGYVPPFYKGKGVYVREGTVTLVAVPNLILNGTRLSPSTLTYKWIVDGTVQGSKSGYGRSSFVYTGSILGKDTIVGVEVTSPSGIAKGKGVILLSPQSPEVLLYERHSLYGTLFNRELSARGFSLRDSEATVTAIPFSTSADSLNDGTLSYLWSINGVSIPVPATQNYATFRNSTGQTGTSVIGVSVSNTTHLLQMMKKTLSINF